MSSQPATPKPSIRSVSCPNCGGTVELRGLGRSLSVVCIQCLSVLDASTPSLEILQRFQVRERIRPRIPLGVRGKMRGDLYEVIGFQVRTMTVEGIDYSWSEYVLFNPYKGFRYLSEYNGHWNDIVVVHSQPQQSLEAGRPVVTLLGEKFRHFQHYRARTTYVMGEFPWKVQVGEEVLCDDYVHPPRILTWEQQEGEANWSLGEYTPKTVIEQNFQLKEKLPEPIGVFANQPAPDQGMLGMAWRQFATWALVLVCVQILFVFFHANKKVFSRTYYFNPNVGGEHSFVTDIFELKGRTSNVKLDLRTDLNNNWAYFQIALINADNGQAFAFGRQVSYYHGRDSDGAWTEGSPQDSVVLSSIPAGKYYLRIEPEMEPQAERLPGARTTVARVQGVNYQITVTRDVPTWGFFWMGVLLLLIPPVYRTLRAGSFEMKRWAESDYSSS
ncbi:MAG: DUF4178 domain-containing protein [Bryobacteraceae bacterium]|nr:DUF4178 domain-containing protein [Bryobacteraceae bacterium]MDW8379029.1 DUF4178 domain-containing protein [Bryobacterales bacterium]